MSDHDPAQAEPTQRPWPQCFALGAVAALTVAASGFVVAQSATADAPSSGSPSVHRVADRP